MTSESPRCPAVFPVGGDHEPTPDEQCLFAAGHVQAHRCEANWPDWCDENCGDGLRQSRDILRARVRVLEARDALTRAQPSGESDRERAERLLRETLPSDYENVWDYSDVASLAAEFAAVADRVREECARECRKVALIEDDAAATAGAAMHMAEERIARHGREIAFAIMRRILDAEQPAPTCETCRDSLRPGALFDGQTPGGDDKWKPCPDCHPACETCERDPSVTPGTCECRIHRDVGNVRPARTVRQQPRAGEEE